MRRRRGSVHRAQGGEEPDARPCGAWLGARRWALRPALRWSSIQEGTVANEDRWAVNVRRSSLSEEAKLANVPRRHDGAVGRVNERDGGFVDLRYRRFLRCEQLARARELDGAARLRLQLGARLVCSMLGAFAMVGVSTMLNRLLAVAISDDHASHRLANVENHSGRARGYERNREKQR